ncbi:hypothetical protein RclHR1_14820005 [Rhizophagus clarus]|uniref:Tc1-like transposase DDE domain-containing protein n=1 Tax=Rhizophagus clarus TaxID=94130 RepID=A0A2Z6QDP0_9GLOM|nr:hypothetical protein RclHR1_14820005 [Rhizophagus clarus]
MVKTLSNDIRWRIIYYQLDGFSVKETALRLYIGVFTVYKIRRIYDHWGCITHLFKGRQGRRKILNLVDLSLQKATKERSELLQNERSLSRAYGYSIKNMKVEKSIVFVRGKWYTILLALTLDGFIAADIIEGSCNKERFQTFILTQVLPQMNEFPNKNSVIVMDNAKIHHDEKLIESIEQMGCKVLYLLPYSPDYNLIETAFSGIKSWLKRNRMFVKNCTDLKYPLLLTLFHVTPDMAKGYFSESIYSY